MASYCCFRKPRTRLPSFTVPRYRLITLHDMLCLILRREGEVVAIEGTGGLGKTWVAKAAFETARNSNRFDTYIWVSLSTSCSVRRCIEKIAIVLSIDIGEELLSSRIRVMIKEHLVRRKFLLVLDNAYFVEENILRILGIPCPREQSLGSKVIVTTRTGRTVSVMDPAILISPQPLTDQASYDLLREKIGRDIDLGLVDNCFGMPLSIILLAGALCDVPEQKSSKLISEAYVALGPKISVFATMIRLVKLCYRRLPSDTARHCFLYCLLFPDDEAIPVKDLIILWKLDGIIQEARHSHQANCYGEEILHVLLKHGLIHFEGDHHIRMHDVIRETVSQLGRDNGYVEQPEKYFDNDIPFEYLLAKFGRRISLMNNTVKEQLRASPSHEFFSTWTLLLRGNRRMRTISEIFFCRLGMLRVLDLSFTAIRILPQSISGLYYLRLLLLVGCEYLEEIQHIGSLGMLEALSASGCGSLKRVECGSFDRMRLLEILDLSGTSIECLPSLAACMALNQLALQDCAFLKSEQTMETDHKSYDTEFIRFPYGVSKTGAVSNLQIGTSKDLVNWMAMLWLPCGLTFEFSDRFGMRVSQDVNQDRKTYIYASHAKFVQSLDKDSPLWSNCLQKFHIVISPLKYDETMNNGFGVWRTKFSAVDAQSCDFNRVLEINCVSNPDDLKGILRHAELISSKSITLTNLVWTLNTGRVTAAQELWVEDCHQLENIFLLEEVATMVKLQNIWISNMDNLAYFCQGMEALTSFSCLMHLLLDCCPKLNFLFPSSLRLPNLRSLQIRFCDNLERVFDKSVSAEQALPRLQSLQLWELPELSCICRGVLPSLKDLKVKGCGKLKGVPIGVTENNPFFATIIGETQWWNDLVWDDESIKRWILFRNWGPLLPHFATEG
ncbi:hypothetical protein CFC21_046001 [Triticum aestivum]|uniref:NB-ARC domain-containing protein n=2 Tax=Triticum aestivum TaxID=4565 RepID=A0A9R1FV76_WHEAT|nr:probable disease resistance protein At1g61300 isoform X1 [Triticum aestivum]KAF7035071.1 hypothetical protein CFC21_046001 [Triticum aestivum]